MIISRSEIDSVAAAYRTEIKRAAQTVPVTIAVDAFEPTSGSTALTALRERISGDPYYRERLVADLKKRIDDGRYFVPSQSIVEKMLGRLFVESLNRS